ncbi:preprotein translocase subunit SecG [Bullifex sp.]|uniref:preprotein translocase subunit SecG n=1 Tax=Bullifex sp. TaxID=2815808 RepID=UPI0039C4BFFF
MFVLVALALIFLIAIQDESSGLSGVFGGSSDSTFGSGSSKFINKVTTILAVAFMVLALLVAFVAKSSNSSSSILDAAASSNSTWYQDTAAQN